jgi:DNA-binding NarL/FixJ family response regulator
MNVLLADDHRLLLEGLNNLLTAHGVKVAGMARDGLEAVALARSLEPDVILMDIQMPRCDGLEATRRIKAEMPQAKIVFLTTSMEEQDLFEAVKSGAFGYLLKSMDAEELVEALEQAREGVPPFSPGLAAKLLSEFARLSGRLPRSSRDPGPIGLPGSTSSPEHPGRE